MDDFVVGLKNFRINKDEFFHNLSSKNKIRVPIYPEDPPVTVGGQLYWNSTDELLYYSIGFGNSAQWIPLQAAGVGNCLCISDIVAGNGIIIDSNTNIDGETVFTISSNVSDVTKLESIGNGESLVGSNVGPCLSVKSLVGNGGIIVRPVFGDPDTILISGNASDAGAITLESVGDESGNLVFDGMGPMLKIRSVIGSEFIDSNVEDTDVVLSLNSNITGAPFVFYSENNSFANSVVIGNSDSIIVVNDGSNLVLEVTGNLDTLNVSGKTNLANVCITNDLIVEGVITANSDLIVNGNLIVGGNEFSLTDLVLTGNLTVNGKTTLGNTCVSNLVVSNDVYIGGDLFVVGNTNIANVDFTDLDLSGNLTVQGKTTLAETCTGNLTVNGQLSVNSCPYTTLTETSVPGLRIIHADPVCFADNLKHTLIKMPFKTPRDTGAISAVVSVYQKGDGTDKFKTKSVSFNDYCARVKGTGPELLGGERIICNPDCFSVTDTFELTANSLDSTIEINVMGDNAIDREWRADMKVCGTNLKNIPVSADYGLQANVFYTELGSTVYSLLDGVTSNAFSISMWINTRALTGDADIISTVDGSGHGTRVSLDSSRIPILEFLDTGSVDFSRVSGTALGLDTWEHLVISYDGSQTGTGIDIYINSVNVNSTATSVGTPTNSTTVPPRIAASPSGTRPFAGLIDELVIYDFDLSAGQVTTIYNSGVSTIDLNLAGPTPIPVNYYRMGDGDSSSTIIDYGTDSRDGINTMVSYSENVPPQSF